VSCSYKWYFVIGKSKNDNNTDNNLTKPITTYNLR